MVNNHLIEEFKNNSRRRSSSNSRSSISSFCSQRKTLFTNPIPNILDFKIFTEGPGVGKYSSEDVLIIKANGFTIPKASRPVTSSYLSKIPG